MYMVAYSLYLDKGVYMFWGDKLLPGELIAHLMLDISDASPAALM